MSANTTLGTAVVHQVSPVFTNYVVVDGTWKEKDSTQMHRTDDGTGSVYNYSFWQQGADCSCDLIIKTGQTKLLKGDVLTETSTETSEGETSARSFVVISADLSDFGGKPLKQSVQLAYHVGFTPGGTSR